MAIASTYVQAHTHAHTHADTESADAKLIDRLCDKLFVRTGVVFTFTNAILIATHIACAHAPRSVNFIATHANTHTHILEHRHKHSLIAMHGHARHSIILGRVGRGGGSRPRGYSTFVTFRRRNSATTNRFHETRACSRACVCVRLLRDVTRNV